LQADASAYFAIWAASLPFAMAMGTYSSMLRSTGDALTPGLISVLTCVLDMIFNFFLINPSRTLVLFGQEVSVWGLGWGVPGAALGTALANAVGGVLALSLLLFRDGVLCIRRPGSWRITKACLQNLWKVGAPLAAERAALSSAQVLLVRIVSGLGTTAIAANSLGVSAESLCYMAGYGVQDASLAMVGQAVGAHRRDMAKRIAWLCTGMGMAIMALTGVGLYVFAPALMGIFTADAAVIALGAQVLRIEAFAEPMFGASIVASGAMQGAGDSTGCFVLNLVSMWGIRLTLAVLLAPRFGLVGVWFAMCAELCTRGALFLLRLARGKWLDKGALA
jgi:putative MATE family efflux protein